MPINFIYTDPQKQVSNRWRNAVAVLVVFGVMGAGVYHIDRSGFVEATVELSERVVPFSLNSLAYATGGGDVVVAPPPEITTPKLPERTAALPPIETFSALKIIVKDLDTGTVLYSKNEYDEHALASITKLMSALIILEKAPDWATTTRVVADDLIDTHMYAGDTYTLEELWNAALIGSSNKAIMTLADAAGWPREAFVARMNEKAREIGMGETLFAEPTGLSKDNVSSASDVVILFDEAMNQKKMRETFVKKEYTLFSKERGKSHHMWNTNWLLLGWIPNEFEMIYGGKTGYIAAAGYNFVTRVQGQNGKTVDVVVLGAESHEARFTESRDIAVWVFEHYTWPDEIVESEKLETGN